jgi:spore coat polysaccharide biosynthesis protein SpsF (cytidylyltransferase family)
MNSSRLPGKVMRRIRGRTILDYVLSRSQAIPGIDVVVCATVDHPDCDLVAAEAKRLGAVVFRGSENDVLARYLGAAKAVAAETIMRVTSDCPLIDPAVCGAVLRLRARSGVDYACNNMPPSWPHGLDCEAFTFDALCRADREAQEPIERENLTRIMRTHPDWSRVSLLGPGGDWEQMRLTLDTTADWDFFVGLIGRLDDPDHVSLSEIAGVVRGDSRLAAINAGEELHHGVRRIAPTALYTEYLPSL